MKKLFYSNGYYKVLLGVVDSYLIIKDDHTETFQAVRMGIYLEQFWLRLFVYILGVDNDHLWVNMC